MRPGLATTPGGLALASIAGSHTVGVPLAMAWVVTTATSGVAADGATRVRLWSAVATALAWPEDPPLVAWCAGAPHVVPAHVGAASHPLGAGACGRSEGVPHDGQGAREGRWQ